MTKRKNNKKRNIIIGSTVLLVIVMGLILFQQIPQSTIYPGSQWSGSYKLIQETNSYYQYRLDGSYSSYDIGQPGYGGHKTEHQFTISRGFQVYGSEGKFPEDMQKISITEDVVLSGGVAFDTRAQEKRQNIDFEIKDIKAVCKPSGPHYNEDRSSVRYVISCDITGTAVTDVPSDFYTPKSARINVNFYKEGFSSPIEIYRASLNNVCSHLIILESEKQVNDYNTLENCQQSFVEIEKEQTSTETVTQEDIDKVDEELEKGITDIKQISQNTGFSENKVKFILEQKQFNIIPFVVVGFIIIITVLIFFIIRKYVKGRKK